jgi:hypothetical protein
MWGALPPRPLYAFMAWSLVTEMIISFAQLMITSNVITNVYTELIILIRPTVFSEEVFSL